MKTWFSLLFAALFIAYVPPARALATSVSPAEWSLYKAHFLDRGGRIIDNGNGGISHTEGQGYGLLLSYLAGNRADFELIWGFTSAEMLLRNDGLAVWKWDPASKPHVTDVNNATDGDLLIAYALALAGTTWNRPDYIAAATRMATAVLKDAVVVYGGRTLLMPASTGFSAKDRADGPVINPSYWIFEAFPVMNVLAPSEKWQNLTDSGLDLLQSLQFGPARLPAEWVSLKRSPQPAAGFAPEFSYNAIRIPLYLARAGLGDAAFLRHLMGAMAPADRPMATVNLITGQPLDPLSDNGYRIVTSLLDCVVNGTQVPAELQSFRPELYYPSTLQLLALSFLREEHPACL
ncbi:glycosyl hydrolase family 8 [Rhizobium sp. SGZ-381]|uniref:glycosyl hydrolase family 8 n=1 Tax=Rhizobium sp. SGZ-381 TaxID=3342800 RepID=UPI0036733218